MRIIRVVLLLISLVFLLDHLPHAGGAASNSRRRRRREPIPDIPEFPNYPEAVRELCPRGFSEIQILKKIRRGEIRLSELPELPEEGIQQEQDERRVFTNVPEAFRTLEKEGHSESEINEMFRNRQIFLTGVGQHTYIAVPHLTERQPSPESSDSFRSDLFTEDEHGGESSALDSESDVETSRTPSRASLRNIRTIRPQKAPEHVRIQKPSTPGKQHRNPNTRRNETRRTAHEEPVLFSQIKSLRIRNDADDSVRAPSTARLFGGKDWRRSFSKLFRRGSHE